MRSTVHRPSPQPALPLEEAIIDRWLEGARLPAPARSPREQAAQVAAYETHIAEMEVGGGGPRRLRRPDALPGVRRALRHAPLRRYLRGRPPRL